jgi:hypothetical protein
MLNLQALLDGLELIQSNSRNRGIVENQAGYWAAQVRAEMSRPTPVAGDGATHPQAENCGDRDCFLCNPPRG